MPLGGTAVALAVLAVTLAALPVPLAAAGWPWRDPRCALVLWQAIGLAGGLSAIGSALCAAVAPLGPTLPGGVLRLAGAIAGGALPAGFGAWHGVALAVAALLALRLAGVFALSAARTVRRRRRHRELVELLAGSTPRAPGAKLLAHPQPVAYCLPGAGGALVLSAGLLDALDERQLAAVLEHERAHLRQRHDLVLLPFAAWRAALPWLRTARLAHEAVVLLVEMVADDAAGARRGAAAVASALGAVVTSAAPDGALAAAGVNTVTQRVRRLLDPPPRLGAPARLAVLGTAFALVVAPTVALLGPAFW